MTSNNSSKNRSQWIEIRNQHVRNLRALLARERRWFVDDPNEDRAEFLDALEWSAAHLDGLPEHWIASSPVETNEQRTPKDYAIEHGVYLAGAAESFIKAVDEHERVVLGFAGEDPDPNIESPDLEKAQQAECDHRDALKNAIYEFRKRAERANSSSQETSDIHPLPCPMCKQRHAPWCPGKSPEKASAKP